MRRLLIAIFILSLLDTVVTLVLLRTGLGREGNPLLFFWSRDFFNNTGMVIAGCTVKFIGTLVAIGILNKGLNHMPKATFAVSWISVIMLAGILLWNLSVFLQV
jgi:hypothetical protein